MTLPTTDDAPQKMGIPHNREAEEALCGAVLINPSCYSEVSEVLTDGPDEFYLHRLRFIWQSYKRLVEKNEPIDFLTVATDLNSVGLLGEVGGPAYLTALFNQVPTTLNVLAYARMVHDEFIRRNMLAAANQIATLAYDPKTPVSELVSQSAHAVTETTRKLVEKHTISIHDSVALVNEDVETRSQSNEDPGIPTGLVDLDRKMGGGAYPSDLNLIAARPGHGKTSLLLQIARHAAMYTDKSKLKTFKNRVLIFSLEMPHKQLTMRLMSQLTGIDYHAIRAGRIPKDKMENYWAAVDLLSTLQIVIDDTPSITPVKVRAKCEIESAKGLDLILLDSLNLMRAGVKFNADYKEVDYCATELKNVARDFVVPVWCAHQMNRATEHRSDDSLPQMSDLREGGEQPADGVIFIHGKQQSDNTITDHKLVIAKQRNGPICNIPVVFRASHFKFENAIQVDLNGAL